MNLVVFGQRRAKEEDGDRGHVQNPERRRDINNHVGYCLLEGEGALTGKEGIFFDGEEEEELLTGVRIIRDESRRD